MEEKLIGKITHYYSKLGVGIIHLTDGDLKVGDTIHIKGSGSDFEQTIDSMQFDHAEIQNGKKGQELGVKVEEKVRDGDLVYKK